ncbi:CDP-glycerol glycerophosphotransferase family protein [Clostridium taeniosporum]|uniref:Glycosyl transferase n=1 Tax=Clostridium taeniosporum TaxID=394958 RepID=A0A1D7XN09_9CLOT|nr:CDP-glycerol glycerophosphotransferase family protein [Clostridium taeniosporum]AOR24722.1 hypothetical protein BGI42_13695 [Clostridium taeniosporum]
MKAVVILSSVSYNDNKMKQRPQHIADCLALKGYDVIYINISEIKKIDLENFNSLVRNFKECTYVKKTNNNIYELDRFSEYNFNGILPIIEKFYKKNNVVFLCGHPDCLDLLSDLDEHSNIIYDCMDDWSEFVHDIAWGKLDIIQKERKLASISKCVIASAKKLCAKMMPYNKNVHYIPNGVNTKDYELDKKIIPEDLKMINGPKILFMGAIAGWVDVELLNFLCKKRPNYNFIFLGNIFKEKLPDFKNVYYLGIKNYFSLKYYTSNVDVSIIAFKKNKLTSSVSPLKFFEYISAGLPVITTMLPELVDKFGAVITKDYDDFLYKLDEVINTSSYNSSEYRKSLKIESQKYDWSILVDNMLCHISDEKLDTNNDFLRLCINKYNNYIGDNIINNEVLTMYNLLNEYGNAKLLAEKIIRNNQKSDLEQLALTFFKTGEVEKSISYIRAFFQENVRYKYYENYLNKIQERDDSKRIFEILLYKLCGREYEALNILDSYINENKNDSFLYFFLASFYIDLHEYDIARNIIFNSIDLAIKENQKIIFEPYSIDYLIEYLIEKKKNYILAEEIMNNLYEMGLGYISDNHWAQLYFYKSYQKNFEDKKNKVAFIIQTPLHYYLYNPVIKELNKLGIEPEIIINDSIKFNDEWSNMYNSCVKFIKEKMKNKLDIIMLSEVLNQSIKYKCLITNTDMGEEVWNIAKYNLGMKYGGPSKEVYSCGWWNINYDTIFCMGNYDYSKLNIYNSCEKIGYPKFDKWFNDKNLIKEEALSDFNLDSNKKTILYAPTYGELSSINVWIKTIKDLQSKYNVIVKMHHGTAYLANELNRRKYIQDNFINVIDDRYDLLKVFSLTDILLIDNSGVMTEGILADLNIIKLDFDFNEECVWLTDENSMDQKIKKHIISVKKENELLEVLDNREIFENQKKEINNLKRILCEYIDGKSGERVAKTIKDFLEDNITKEDNYFRKNLLNHIKQLKS